MISLLFLFSSLLSQLSKKITGQPQCISFLVCGAFPARAVPVYGRDENQPLSMISSAGSEKHPIGALYMLTHQSRSRLTSDPWHLLTYRNEGMLRRRYDNLRCTLRDMTTTAGLIAEEEPRGLPGFGTGGGDLLARPYDIHPGQAAVADVYMVSEHMDALAETDMLPS